MAKRKTLQAGASDPASKSPPKLSWSQERFVEEYLRHGNATLAYRNSYPKASPSVCQPAGSRLLSNVIISDAISQKREADREFLNFKRQDALAILVGMATASLDDFTSLFSDCADPENYLGFGYKRHAIESVKKTTITMEDGSVKETNEIKIISPGERKAVINELWEKLGLGETANTKDRGAILGIISELGSAIGRVGKT